jgi:hypothetical protein
LRRNIQIIYKICFATSLCGLNILVAQLLEVKGVKILKGRVKYRTRDARRA